MITAPFNFVPLNKDVFFPEWSEKVSYDIPFSDGESGEIEVSITAKSPIFVRDSKDDTKFCNYNGEFFIPATSVKGMIRNVLEIISFSKLKLYTDNTYAVRDLSKADNFYMTQMREKVYAGWLVKKGDEYIIEDCGEPYRISHQEIDKAFNINFASKFQKEGFEKTSEYKYKILGGLKSIKVSNPYKSASNPKYDKRQFCKYDPKGKKGILIVTGQPTIRKNTGKMGDGKGFEFVFLPKKGELKVEKDVFENFKFAYFDRRDTEPKESPDWTFWKKKLYAGEKIPIFFQKEKEKVLHFGLSYLYKLPYKNSISKGILSIHKSKKLDLTDTIFGCIDNINSLKGRVFISHFKAKNAKELSLRSEILGTPRASYYPMYVVQNGVKYITYMDGNFEIAGRKRYPIHKSNIPIKTLDTGNEKVATTFKPLDSGVLFSGKIKFHNLRKSEIGAILSALTFHNTPNTYHNIGLAKPLGYGKIKIEIKFNNLEEYLKAFEREITLQINNWANSDEITELVTMATEQDSDKFLKYMDLKEFAKHKNKLEYLQRYTKIKGVKPIKIKTLIDENELKMLEEAKKYAKELNEALLSDNLQKLKNFLSKANEKDKLKIEEKIKKIEEEENKQKELKLQEEVKLKFEAILKLDKKLQKKAFEDFIHKYKDINSEYLQKAKDLLSLKDEKDSNLSLDDINNPTLLKKYIQTQKDIDLEKLSNKIIEIYNSLKGKKKKSFFKDIQLARFVSKEYEEKIKNKIKG